MIVRYTIVMAVQSCFMFNTRKTSKAYAQSNKYTQSKKSVNPYALDNQFFLVKLFIFIPPGTNINHMNNLEDHAI